MTASVDRMMVGDESRAIAASGTAATHERSRNLRCVSAVPVGLSQGPSRAFLALTRNPSLEPPARFEPTVKSEGDIVL